MSVVTEVADAAAQQEPLVIDLLDSDENGDEAASTSTKPNDAQVKGIAKKSTPDVPQPSSKIADVAAQLAAVVIDLDSDGDEGASTSTNPNDAQAKRIAKKTTTPDLKQPPAAPSRRKGVSAKKTKKTNYTSQDKFMENFNPESSAREQRKLTRKVKAINASTRKALEALFDENGVHKATGLDLCDCYQKGCPGCYFPCPKCKSLKCGPVCRCNRKFAYDEIEYQGCDVTVKSPYNVPK